MRTSNRKVTRIPKQQRRELRSLVRRLYSSFDHFLSSMFDKNAYRLWSKMWMFNNNFDSNLPQVSSIRMASFSVLIRGRQVLLWATKSAKSYIRWRRKSSKFPYESIRISRSHLTDNEWDLMVKWNIIFWILTHQLIWLNYSPLVVQALEPLLTVIWSRKWWNLNWFFTHWIQDANRVSPLSSEYCGSIYTGTKVCCCVVVTN